jgi:hypothetical protein
MNPRGERVWRNRKQAKHNHVSSRKSQSAGKGSLGVERVDAAGRTRARGITPSVPMSAYLAFLGRRGIACTIVDGRECGGCHGRTTAAVQRRHERRERGRRGKEALRRRQSQQLTQVVVAVVTHPVHHSLHGGKGMEMIRDDSQAIWRRERSAARRDFLRTCRLLFWTRRERSGNEFETDFGGDVCDILLRFRTHTENAHLCNFRSR